MMATLEVTSSTPRDVTPVHVVALAVGTGGAGPFVVATTTLIEGGLGFEVLITEDFALHSEALKAFASSSYCLRSKEIKLSMAWSPSKEMEARLEATAW